MPEAFKSSKKYRRIKVLDAWRRYNLCADEDPVEAKALSTQSTYIYAWRVYLHWCEGKGLEAGLPIPSERLRQFVRDLAEQGRAASTINSYVAGIATLHRYRGHAIDRAPLIERLKAIRRRAGPPHRARPLMRKELAKILAKLEPTNARHARDAALMLLGWSAALRSAELVGLDWLQFGGNLGGGTGILASERYGLQVELLTSKTAQLERVSVGIPHLDAPSVRPWVEKWIELAGVQPGEPIFRPIDHRGRIVRARLAAPAVTTILRRRIVEHELGLGTLPNRAHAIALSYSSHSLRRGYVSTASEAGISLGEIRTRSRHSSDEVLAGYIRSAQAWRHAGLRKIGI